MELVFTDGVDILSVLIVLTPQTAKVARGFFSFLQTVSELTDITYIQLKFVIVFVFCFSHVSSRSGGSALFYFLLGISAFRKLAIKIASLGFLWKFPLVL